jgi:hypothetical protein
MIIFFLISIWLVEVVDSGNYKFVSIEVNNLLPIIAYGGDIYSSCSLSYAIYDGTNWNTYYIDTIPGGIISLKRNNDSLFLAYTDGARLCLAKSYNGINWIKENTGLYLDPHDAISLDIGFGKPQIIYFSNFGYSLIHTYKEGGFWITDTIHKYAPGDGAGFSIDQYNIPHVTFYSLQAPNGLVHSKKIGSSWIKEQITSEGAIISSLLTLDSNRVYVLYPSSGVNSSLIFAFDTSINWNFEIVKDSAYAGIEGLLNFQNKFLCTFFNLNRTKLFFAERIYQNNWNIEIVDEGNFVMFPTIDIDSEGNPHIAYVDAVGRIKHAKRVTRKKEISPLFKSDMRKKLQIIDILGRKVNSHILKPGNYFVNSSKQKMIIIQRIK